MKKLKFFAAFILIGGCLLVYVSSCNNNGVNSPGMFPSTPQSASLSVMAVNPTIPPVNNNTIVLTDAKFLFEFVKLEKSHGSDDADLKEGPFVVHINLTGAVTPIALNSVGAGTYMEVHLKIHKHEPQEPVIDPDFGTSGVVGFSGVITGAFDGVPFVFRTTFTISREVDIDPPLVVVANSTIPVNVTLAIDVKSWFLDAGGFIMNPLDPNNREMIENNIKQSIRNAFRDDDKDGHPDHGH